jgi:hypothetical protein
LKGKLEGKWKGKLKGKFDLRTGHEGSDEEFSVTVIFL